MSSKSMDYENINENVKKCQYAVRGELYLRASELQKEGKKIVFTNVGNPHALGQKPLTFPRQVSDSLCVCVRYFCHLCLLILEERVMQVVALCQAPFLLDDPNVGLLFPADAIARAKHYLSMTPGGLDGASKGVMQILNAIIRGPVDGILVPVPQYPLYSATISLLGGSLVPYYLEETANWGLDVVNLNQSIAKARSQGITVRAMVIINPGNPTGQCLSEANLKEVLKFCYQNNLVLIGDEVYQQNVYQDERPFISSRKTVEEIYKVASISLSPTVPGQIFMGLMVNPLKPGDISYEKFISERVFHLRTTILPAEEDMPEIMASFKKFNDEFMDQYEDLGGYSRM
ncbi:alanine aminotransferase [Dorcoceras hygrometricum]|uniref:Alanine aminotransferase n=1 Tax=Dorcoceras hygrometricum TaxID=472368 RepID=A0A2Z7DEZ8_9LAMI|nr:alanine aminotransferase [Dorcoceras hygrometricum]